MTAYSPRTQVRNRRAHPVRARTEACGRVARQGPVLLPAEDLARPRTRGECAGGARPCPFVGCKYSLFLDVTRKGSIKFNFPDLEPEEMRESCALDVADRGGQPLHVVGRYANVTRERVRQLEVKLLDRLEPDLEALAREWRTR